MRLLHTAWTLMALLLQGPIHTLAHPEGSRGASSLPAREASKLREVSVPPSLRLTPRGNFHLEKRLFNPFDYAAHYDIGDGYFIAANFGATVTQFILDGAVTYFTSAIQGVGPPATSLPNGFSPAPYTFNVPGGGAPIILRFVVQQYGAAIVTPYYVNEVLGLAVRAIAQHGNDLLREFVLYTIEDGLTTTYSRGSLN